MFLLLILHGVFTGWMGVASFEEQKENIAYVKLSSQTVPNDELPMVGSYSAFLAYK